MTDHCHNNMPTYEVAIIILDKNNKAGFQNIIIFAY